MEGRFCIGRILMTLAAAGAISVASGADCVALRPNPEAWESALAAPGRLADMVTASAERLTNVIDVLIAFDTSASSWLAENGKGSASAFAKTCEAKMNRALSDSKLLNLFRFRVVGTVSLSVDLSTLGGLEFVIDRFVTDTGEVADTAEGRTVSTAREKFGADIVSVLVATGSGGVKGIGYTLYDDGSGVWRKPSQIPLFGDWAYNACSIEAVDNSDTQVHEIAHNMGCDHPDETLVDPNRVIPGPGLFDYSAGYCFWSGGVGYHTIMAYNFGGVNASGTGYSDELFQPTGTFSSPLIEFDGVPAGDALHDNRRTLATVFPFAAKYRASKVAYVEEDPDAPTEVNGVTGAFNPRTAYKSAAPYVGTVLDESGDLVALVQLKIGKANAKKRISKVSGSVITMDGKKHSIRSVSFPIGSVPKTSTGITIANFGTMSLTLGSSGFYGEITSKGRKYVARTGKAGGKLSGETHSVVLSDDFDLGVDGVLEDLLPLKGEPFTVSANRWVFRPAAKVKYKGKLLVTGGANASAMKLTYKSAVGTFKGSFKAYALKTVGAKKKIVKYKVSITGLVAEGEGIGVATCRQRSGSWKVTVQ